MHFRSCRRGSGVELQRLSPASRAASLLMHLYLLEPTRWACLILQRAGTAENRSFGSDIGERSASGRLPQTLPSAGGRSEEIGCG